MDNHRYGHLTEDVELFPCRRRLAEINAEMAREQDSRTSLIVWVVVLVGLAAVIVGAGNWGLSRQAHAIEMEKV